MKVDTAGNVYSGGSGGIYIIDPKGKKLGRIVHGRPETTNIAFGGDDWKTLYFTNWYYLGAVKVKVPGIPVPTPKRSSFAWPPLLKVVPFAGLDQFVKRLDLALQPRVVPPVPVLRERQRRRRL